MVAWPRGLARSLQKNRTKKKSEIKHNNHNPRISTIIKNHVPCRAASMNKATKLYVSDLIYLLGQLRTGCVPRLKKRGWRPGCGHSFLLNKGPARCGDNSGLLLCLPTHPPSDPRQGKAPQSASRTKHDTSLWGAAGTHKGRLAHSQANHSTLRCAHLEVLHGSLLICWVYCSHYFFSLNLVSVLMQKKKKE